MFDLSSKIGPGWKKTFEHTINIITSTHAIKLINTLPMSSIRFLFTFSKSSLLKCSILIYLFVCLEKFIWIQSKTLTIHTRTLTPAPTHPCTHARTCTHTRVHKHTRGINQHITVIIFQDKPSANPHIITRM